MAYTTINFKTKKALKESLENDDDVRVFLPGLGTLPRDGTIYLEGPHYPEPHKWYAQGTMKDGKLIKIK